MAQTTVDHLERRYAALEKEIEEALHHGPTDDLAVADLKYYRRRGSTQSSLGRTFQQARRSLN